VRRNFEHIKGKNERGERKERKKEGKREGKRRKRGKETVGENNVEY